MPSRHIVAVLLSSIMLASAPPSFGRSQSSQQARTQDADSAWLRARRIAPGAEVIVEPTRGDAIQGRFVSASDSKLSLYIEGKDFEINRSSIRKIWGVKLRSRSKSTLGGAGIGLASGVGLGALVVAGSDKTTGVNLAPVSFGFVGMVVGAAIGALRGGKHRGTLLYESP